MDAHLGVSCSRGCRLHDYMERSMGIKAQSENSKKQSKITNALPFAQIKQYLHKKHPITV